MQKIKELDLSTQDKNKKEKIEFLTMFGHDLDKLISISKEWKKRIDNRNNQ